MSKEYNIGIYIRLSMADEDTGYGNKSESDSIGNQRMLINRFLDNHPELSRCQRSEFADDGYTGTNFHRPQFTQMMEKVKRGEIYLYDFGTNEGSIQNGLRPALVVQCDEGNKASCTTVIAAMTTVIKKRYLPSHIILGDRFGLKEPSMVMLEQLRTVNQADLLEYIGKIDDEHCMKKINIGVKKALGLWVDKPYRKPADMRCLCVKCLESYKNSPNYIVKRLDPFAKAKEKCDKCQSYGYDYLVIERSKEGR